MVQKKLNIVGAIAVAIVLWQSSPVAAGPNYGLSDSVPGSQGLAVGVADVATYLATLAGSELSDGTLVQSAFSLPAIVGLLQTTGTHLSEAGISGTEALAALIDGSSGSSITLFDSVLQTIQDGLDHLADHLPETKSSLFTLIGSSVPDRLTDGFDRIEAGLHTLQDSVQSLKDAIAAAIAEAGSDTSVSAAIMQKHVKLRLVYNLSKAVQYLRAYLPVVRYTLNTAIEDAVTADAFLVAYEDTVGSLATLVDFLLDPLDVAQEAFFGGLDTGVDELETSFMNVQEDTQLLIMIEIPELSAAISDMLATFETTVGDVGTDLAAVATSLEGYMSAIEQSLAITDTEVTSVSESELVSALVHVLIDGGKYARYCFHKYEPLVATLIDSLLDRTGLCVEREVPRLANLASATSYIIEYITYDIEDISDLLFVCDEILDPTDESTCVTTISDSITPLGALFADKYALLYDLTDTELSASRQRVKICVELSKRLFSDTYIPDLRSEIEACALDGPNVV